MNHVITGMGFGRVRKEQYVEAAQKTKDAWAAVGMTIAGVEGHPVPFDKLKAGVEGADEEIENTKWAIEALSKVGINMICYNFMAGLGWTRTNTKLPERGGALTSEFDATAPAMQGLTRYGEISEEKMWANITKFLKEVIPVADKFKVKMALHPDDPPLSPLRGDRPHLYQRQELPPDHGHRPQPDERRDLLPGQLQADGRGHLRAGQGVHLARRRSSSSTSATWRGPSRSSTRPSTTTVRPTWSAC